MPLNSVFIEKYNETILLSPFQAKAIGCAVLACGPGCRLLVFGLGNDTPLWLGLNKDGHTQFLESNENWIEKSILLYPGLNVAIMPTFGFTVASSANVTEGELSACEIPSFLRGSTWDVIVVDGPPGHSQTDPGRAVAIYWAANLATPSTDVFVDDYNRPLEKRFADEFLASRRLGASVVISASDLVRSRMLFWSMGSPIGTAKYWAASKAELPSKSITPGKSAMLYDSRWPVSDRRRWWS